MRKFSTELAAPAGGRAVNEGSYNKVPLFRITLLLSLLKEKFFYSENSPCGACGEPLGRQKIWNLVFSDDPPDLIELVRSGEINFVKCPHCGFDGGWFWTTFLYVDVEEERVVCVIPSPSVSSLVELLREALNSPIFRERGLDPERLLKRTQFIHNYWGITNALTVPIERIEMEMEAIFRYLDRKELSGRSRIEHIINDLLNERNVTLETDECTTEFLDEFIQYRAALSGDEDPRIPEFLERTITGLTEKLVTVRRRLPGIDEMSGLAEIFKQSRKESLRRIVGHMIDEHLRNSKSEVLRSRLAYLCVSQSNGNLQMEDSAPIDRHPELLSLLEKLISGQEENAELDIKVLKKVKKFILSLSPDMPQQKSRPTDKPPDEAVPPWIAAAFEVRNEIFRAAAQKGVVSESIWDSIKDIPLAMAFIYAEIGQEETSQGSLSSAMARLLKALDLVREVYESSIESPSPWVTRLYAVCTERLGRLYIRYGRPENAAAAFNNARSLYEKMGARDGVVNTLRAESTLWLELHQYERVEQIAVFLTKISEGSGWLDEIWDLINLANVYNSLPPWLVAEADFTSGEDTGNQPSEKAENLAGPSRDQLEAIRPPEDSFKTKGGIRITYFDQGPEQISFRSMAGNEQIRLLYRALAVAILNGNSELEVGASGRLLNAYTGKGCPEIAEEFFHRIMENSTLESAGPDVQFFALNRLEYFVDTLEKDGEPERAHSIRAEQLHIMEFILNQKHGTLSPFMLEELRAEKACILEGLDRTDEAQREYHDTIERLERSRMWMRDPDNKTGFQQYRWRPYVRAARNLLRKFGKDPSQTELLTGIWNYIQAGHSRALLDASAGTDDGLDSVGMKSIRPAIFQEVSSQLDKDMAVLEFVLIPASSGCPGCWMMFVIEPGSDSPWIAWQEPNMEPVLEAQESLADIARQFETTVVEYGFESVSGVIEKSYISALEKLADILFPPGLLDKLRSLGYRRLVIVADAYLHQVPFAALLPKQNRKRAYLGIPDKNTGFQIIYAPSSSIFSRWARKGASGKPGNGGGAALFMDPLGDLSKHNPAVDQTFLSIQRSLRARKVKVKRLKGKKATPDSWLEEGRKHGLVVYYGHSAAGQANIEHAALILSDGKKDGILLTADHIYRLATQAYFSRNSLFIFASCSGGYVTPGAWSSDRELKGLSAAHLYAGVGSVIAASRPLLDTPTLSLLIELVTELLTGCDVLTGLTNAQVKLVSSRRFAHPHFWGYVGLMGSPDWRLTSTH